MILDALPGLKNYVGSKYIDSVLLFIDKVNANEVAIGEWIKIKDDLKAIVLCKSGYIDGVFEAHTEFNDIHIVVDGSDTIYLGDKLSASITKPYDENGDYTLYSSKVISSCKMYKNTFAFIPKEEIHTNQIEDEFSKKIVLKIK
ncbi:MAG: YhcH/YjgK/YiaL family protein [Bacteroidetes bacterium]|nr:YhcH/YjgK/YiaL family protein [Bacteroidota bacterium]